MVYNFRIDRNNIDTLISRIKNKNLLSQGWGGGENGDLSLLEDNFLSKTKTNYDLRTTRIPTNLTKIKSFRDSDIIVIPHLPTNGKFSIHIVDGDFPDCYDYLSSDEAHLNHTIKVKKSFGLEGNLSLYNKSIASWKGKLQWLRLPIIPINQYQSEFLEIIDDLKENPRKVFDKSSLDDFLTKLQVDVIDDLKKELNEISHSGGEINFESICEFILNQEGYETVKRHQYDGEGGDIDLFCTKDKTDISPFEQGQTNLYVQIKKHTGKTDEKAVEQLLQMIQDDPEANGCVMSLADGFTKKAEQLADENGIVLVNGRLVSELLLINILQNF